MRTNKSTSQKNSQKKRLVIKWDTKNRKWVVVDLNALPPAEKSPARKKPPKASAVNPLRRILSKASAKVLPASNLCCYSNSLNGFWKETSKEAWINKMKTAYKRNIAFARLLQSEELGFAWKNQIRAWADCYDTMQMLKKRFLSHNRLKKYGYFGIIFEYLLPTQDGDDRGYGKRPDVLLVCDDFIWVLEFKTGTGAPEDNARQVREYANYLKEHHNGCSDKKIIPMLVYTGTAKITDELKSRIGDEVHACTSSELAYEIEKYSPNFIKEIDYIKWIQASFD